MFIRSEDVRREKRQNGGGEIGGGDQCRVSCWLRGS